MVKESVVIETVAMAETASFLSMEELAVLKSTLDALQELLTAMEGFVANLPPESPESIVFAESLDASLNGMKFSLLAINGALVGTAVSGSNLASDVSAKGGEMVGVSDKAAPVGVVESETLASSEKVASRSSISPLLNPSKAVLVFLAFAVIFGIVLFLRKSRSEEVQPA